MPGADLFVRKDFPQGLGVAIVTVGLLASCVAWGYSQLYLTFGILFATALVDVVLYVFVPNALMCYRCGAMYRALPTSTAMNRSIWKPTSGTGSKRFAWLKRNERPAQGETRKIHSRRTFSGGRRGHGASKWTQNVNEFKTICAVWSPAKCAATTCLCNCSPATPVCTS